MDWNVLSTTQGHLSTKTKHTKNNIIIQNQFKTLVSNHSKINSKYKHYIATLTEVEIIKYSQIYTISCIYSKRKTIVSFRKNKNPHRPMKPMVNLEHNPTFTPTHEKNKTKNNTF